MSKKRSSHSFLSGSFDLKSKFGVYDTENLKVVNLSGCGVIQKKELNRTCRE